VSSVNFAQCRSKADLSPRYMFSTQFVRRPTGVDVPTDFNLRVVGTNVPKRTANEPDEIFMHGHRISQPGVESSEGELSLTMFETVDAAVFNMISQWRELNRANDSGVMAPRSLVTADLRLKLLNRQKLPYYQYTIYDAWIKDVEVGALDGTARNGIMSDVGITLQYDHMVEGPV